MTDMDTIHQESRITHYHLDSDFQRDLGHGIKLLLAENNTVLPNEIFVEHICQVYLDYDYCVAAHLNNNHMITCIEGIYDVVPSVRCNKCGLHGYIRKGRWIPIP